MAYVTGDVSFDKSIHRALKLVGYAYTKERVAVNKTIWRCEDRSCKGRLHLDEQEQVINVTEHMNHAPDPVAFCFFYFRVYIWRT